MSARKEKARGVNVVDFMKPAEIRIPEAALIDERNQESREHETQWHIASKLTTDWMMQANLNPDDFNIEVDPVKLTVAPKKAVPKDMRVKLEQVMANGGFLPTKIKKVNGWRMNKLAVTG